MDVGTCEMPGGGAVIGIVRRQGLSGDDSIVLPESASPIDCDSDLQCAGHTVTWLTINEGATVGPVDAARLQDETVRCACEDFGTGGATRHCDDESFPGTAVQIELVSDACVAGSFQRTDADTSTPFVAFFCG